MLVFQSDTNAQLQSIQGVDKYAVLYFEIHMN